jgi:hypothetical protein
MNKSINYFSYHNYCKVLLNGDFKVKMFKRAKVDEMVEFETDEMRLFLAYRCPVAIYDKKLNQYFKTDLDMPVVHRRIDEWLEGAKSEVKPQSYFEELIK